MCLGAQFLEQTLACAKRSLVDTEDIEVQFAAIGCLSDIQEFVTDNRIRIQQMNDTSTKVHILLEIPCKYFRVLILPDRFKR